MTADQKLILLNETALQLKPDAVTLAGGARVFVAGRSLVTMTLAELALPGAEMIWTDFRHSASLGGLHRAVQAAGGLDRMILAADGDHGEAMFSVMCAVLTFLPALRRRPGAEVELIILDGSAIGSLIEFAERIAPKLAEDGVRLTLDTLPSGGTRAAA